MCVRVARGAGAPPVPRPDTPGLLLLPLCTPASRAGDFPPRGRGGDPRRKVRRRPGGEAALPVAARELRLESEASGAAGVARPRGAGAGCAMRGTRAALFRQLPQLALLLLLLFQRARPHGEFWDELVRALCG